MKEGFDPLKVPNVLGLIGHERVALIATARGGYVTWFYDSANRIFTPMLAVRTKLSDAVLDAVRVVMDKKDVRSVLEEALAKAAATLDETIP